MHANTRNCSGSWVYNLYLSEDNPITIHYIKIGDEYRKMGQPDQAIESYQQALKADPGNLKAQSNIGAIHLELQEYEEAAAAFELALHISGEDLVAKAGWCDANLALGNQARADGKIEEATRILFGGPESLSRRSQCP